MWETRIFSEFHHGGNPPARIKEPHVVPLVGIKSQAGQSNESSASIPLQQCSNVQGDVTSILWW